MQYSCIISHQSSPLERRVRDILIVIVMNFVVVSSVGIKRVDCINLFWNPCKENSSKIRIKWIYQLINAILNLLSSSQIVQC